jgi:hypothetical protein
MLCNLIKNADGSLTLIPVTEASAGTPPAEGGDTAQIAVSEIPENRLKGRRCLYRSKAGNLNTYRIGWSGPTPYEPTVEKVGLPLWNGPGYFFVRVSQIRLID